MNLTLKAARRPETLPALMILIVAALSPGHAAGQGSAPIACPDPTLAPVVSQVPDRRGAPVTLDARAFDARAGAGAEASGDVDLRRADQHLSTETLRYDPSTRTVTIPEPLVYRDAQINVFAESAKYSFLEEAGIFLDVEYSLTGASANGRAEDIRVDAARRSHLRGLQFTTCPGGEPAWLLSASEVEFRHDEGIGIARNARLQFMDVPILYLPWMSFPINEQRKSGFLYPHASNANDNGFEIGIPYYWNIAPNQDATLTPRFFTDRGVMLTGEYRAITPRTANTLEFDYLADDDRTGKRRYHYQLHHATFINPQWRGQVALDRVSDDQYFQDFGLSLAQTARQFLHSIAGIDGVGRYWTFSMLADDFQVIDESVSEFSEPYRRLPRVAFRLDRPFGGAGFQFMLDSEAVYFDREVGVTGARVDLYPRLGWGLDRYWGFLRTTLGYRQTSYHLDLGEAAGDESPQRGTEIFSIDAGVLLERTLQSGRVQTLEPRVFYLYVPYEDQAALPDFDTAEFTFGFSQLFHTNRFTGADRQTDANQLTLAATTRTLDPATGRERWSLSVGQVFYFEPPRVSLYGTMPEDVDTSALVAEFNWHPLDRFTGRLGVQWNWENSELDLGTLGLDYRARGGSRVGFEYRYRRDRLDQFDFRFHWPINERWSTLSRLKYSLDDSDLLEALVGVEYESCCWGVRLVGRRYLRSRFGDERDAIYLELHLKGLGSFGRRTQPLFYDEAD
ncbi:MAG: LPS assembly protein LptD [Xanthomonadales bacterium]|nr:LPS assembly protein LptD [Xanthomonadales bacterium]NIX12256.1 LPS assembly protein LptD [Xanthomonadales bacterium]